MSDAVSRDELWDELWEVSFQLEELPEDAILARGDLRERQRLLLELLRRPRPDVAERVLDSARDPDGDRVQLIDDGTSPEVGQERETRNPL